MDKTRIPDGWTEIILWFKREIDDMYPLEFRLLVPPNCSDEDRIKLIDKNASQIAGLILQLDNTKIIIQGAYTEHKRCLCKNYYYIKNHVCRNLNVCDNCGNAIPIYRKNWDTNEWE
jgi:hypothetical protein